MYAYTFIWCQLSLRSIFMYKLNLHFRRVLIITWHGKHRAQINVKMFFFQGYVRKISPCKSSIFLPFLSLSGISDPHWNGTEYMVTKINILNHWDQRQISCNIFTRIIQVTHDKVNSKCTKCHNSQNYEDIFKLIFVVIISYFKAHTTCALDIMVEMFTW